MAKGKGGSETTQTQQVSQSTTVSVQNVIEGRGLEPLERVKLLSEILATIDTVDAAGKSSSVPAVAIVQQAAQPFAFLQDGKTVLMLAAAVLGVVFVSAKIKRA